MSAKSDDVYSFKYEPVIDNALVNGAVTIKVLSMRSTRNLLYSKNFHQSAHVYRPLS